MLLKGSQARLYAACHSEAEGRGISLFGLRFFASALLRLRMTDVLFAAAWNVNERPYVAPSTIPTSSSVRLYSPYTNRSIWRSVASIWRWRGVLAVGVLAAASRHGASLTLPEYPHYQSCLATAKLTKLQNCLYLMLKSAVSSAGEGGSLEPVFVPCRSLLCAEQSKARAKTEAKPLLALLAAGAGRVLQGTGPALSVSP